MIKYIPKPKFQISILNIYNTHLGQANWNPQENISYGDGQSWKFPA